MNNCLVIYDDNQELCDFDRVAKIVFEYETGYTIQDLHMYYIDEKGDVCRMWCYMSPIDEHAHSVTYTFHDTFFNECGQGTVKLAPAACDA